MLVTYKFCNPSSGLYKNGLGKVRNAARDEQSSNNKILSTRWATI